ncbi:hypothetical protein BS50DRAFT_576357 [Corynespora cassiicola Philippines]|uniref:C2H2-type domain-containing protein n=1 Tax=Corynespora cassiicola Philippines TaxID=1448308 RepID=A0A2T2NE74_CORCC|nr:hypothetical protein BS50DRAFT_576357 [Corynespora cassiicola Philippines]
MHGDHFTFYSEADSPWNTQSHTTNASVVDTPSNVSAFTGPEQTIIPPADNNSDEFEGSDTIGVDDSRTLFSLQRSPTIIRRGSHATELLHTNTIAIPPVKRCFRCNKCSSSFLDGHQLRNHMRNQHTRYPCTKVGCGAEYRHRKSLWQHQKEKHELKKYECDQCAYTSGRVGNLKRHKAKMHIEDG